MSTSKWSTTKTACSNCHKRKVRCNYPYGQARCVNCEIFNAECSPHCRKRKTQQVTNPAPKRHLQHQEQQSEASFLSGRAPVPDCPPELPTTYLLHTPEHSEPSEAPSDRHETVSEARLGDESPYVSRTEILGPGPFTERLLPRKAILSTEDNDLRCREVLKIFDADATVSEPVAARLISLYRTFCWPWAPIVEKSWLLPKSRSSMPLLLLQSVLLTGSRVSSTGPLSQSMQLYLKAKARFFYGDDRMPLASVISAILLQWWSPTGPEHFSLGNSGFWLHITIGLAHQLGLHREPPQGPYRGLRRRIWWTIVTRDILISVGVGRPRMISLEDSDVSPPCIHDFREDSTETRVFISYVAICRILGDVAEMRRKSRLTRERRREAEKSLMTWLRDLPSELRLFSSDAAEVPSQFDLQSRQLHIIFFVSLIVLANAEDANAASVTSIVSASFVASIFAELQEHGELQRLGPIFAFHGLAAALPLLSAQKFRTIASDAMLDFEKIYSALQELAEKWGSARGLLEPLAAARETARSSSMEEGSSSRQPPAAKDSLLRILSNFGPGLCLLWWLIPEDSGVVDCISSSLRVDKAESEKRADVSQDVPPERQDALTPGSFSWAQLADFDNVNLTHQPWEGLPMQTFLPDDSWMDDLADP